MAEKLYYIEIGRGSPLICLHGYALDHTIWLDMAEEMKSNVRLILPDLRGHGKSPSPEGKYSMLSMAEDILQIMDSLSIERATIAGHSMGGYIALALAELHQDRLLGLALIASHAFTDLPEKKRARLEDIEKLKMLTPLEVLSGMPGKLSKDIRVTEYCKTLISRASKNGILGVLAGMAERPDKIDIMASLKIPVIAIVGIDDQLIPLKTSKDMVPIAKRMQLIEILNAGHMPMMEKPQETAKALFNFIKTSEEIYQ
jgi:3-oxoadipate enol-lactonase